jgi:hypothetical protein
LDKEIEELKIQTESMRVNDSQEDPGEKVNLAKPADRSSEEKENSIEEIAAQLKATKADDARVQVEKMEQGTGRRNEHGRGSAVDARS